MTPEQRARLQRAAMARIIRARMLRHYRQLQADATPSYFQHMAARGARPYQHNVRN